MPSGITGRDGFLPALVKSIRRSFPCRHPTTGGSLKGSPAGTPLTHRFLYYPYSTTAAAVCQPSFCPGPQPAGRRDGPSGEFARNVGLSNRLDGELVGRAPEEGPHGEVVGAAVVDRKLLCEIVQRIECVAGIEAFLVLTVAALHLAVVPRGIRANQLMPGAQLSSRPLKQLGLCVLVGMAVGPPGLEGPYHSGALLLRTSLGKTAILHLCFGTEKNRRLGSKKARYNRAFRRRHLFCLHIMVDLKGFEPSTSRMRTERSPS